MERLKFCNKMFVVDLKTFESTEEVSSFFILTFRQDKIYEGMKEKSKGILI